MRRIKIEAYKLTSFNGRRKGSLLTKLAAETGHYGVAYLVQVGGKKPHAYYLAKNGLLIPVEPIPEKASVAT